jgi:hypothetical protein
MTSLEDAIQPILKQPTPEALVALQGALLASGRSGDALSDALEFAGHFYRYLCELRGKISAKDYSELASRLDIGAVGAVALENLIASEVTEFWKRLLLGGLGETLMVAASRQYIKAWQVETDVEHACATWCLADSLWRVSAKMQPSLPDEQRWQAIQALLAPARDPRVSGSEKALLLGRVFQLLLLTYLARLFPFSEDESS